ncbi:MAG: tetratricopeptide repeat protein [Deltaproteobacteria bacterium]|nr:tetratricopeptide repeat protein [Deltaproteobacteria bacterium]
MKTNQALVVVFVVLIGWVLLGCRSEDSQASLDAIRARVEQRDYAAAVELLQPLVEAEPDDAELALLYGRALMGSGQPSLAVWPLSRALDDPDYGVEAGILLTAAQMMVGSTSDAVNSASVVLAVEPENRQAMVLRARALIIEKNEQEAFEQIEALLESAPDDLVALQLRFQALLGLGRIEESVEAVALMREILAKAENLDPRIAAKAPQIAAQLCAGAATFAEERGEIETAEQLFEECLAAEDESRHRSVLVRTAAEFFDEQGNVDRATAIWRETFEADPGNLNMRVVLANRLASLGRRAEAESLLREVTTRQPAAWTALADFFLEGEDVRGALEAIEGAIASTPRPKSTWLLSRADYLIILGELARADEALAAIEVPVHRYVIQGRLQLVRNQPEAAAKSLEQAVRLWPDNGSVRFMLGQAAEGMGDFSAAMDQYKEANRYTVPHKEASLALASLLAAYQNWAGAFFALGRLVEARKGDPEVLEAYIDLARRSGQEKPGRKTLIDLSQLPGQAARAIALAITIAGETAGVAGALRVATESELDLTLPASEPALAALVLVLGKTGRHVEALEWAGAAVKARPDFPAFVATHAEALLLAGRVDEAMAGFEAAQKLDPKFYRAAIGRARSALAADQIDAAMELFRAAAELESDSVEPPREIARLRFEAGQRAEAQAMLREHLKRHPRDGIAARLLAEQLRAQGGADAQELRQLTERAALFDPSAASSVLHGRVLFEQGEAESAASLFEAAIVLEPKASSAAYYYLGRARFELGQRSEAATAFRKALAQGEFSESRDARARLAALEDEGSGA